jgi:hypothetical protein
MVYSHPPLIDINWFLETSLNSDSLVNEPSFNVCFAFHCRACNFTSFIQKVAKWDEEQ